MIRSVAKWAAVIGGIQSVIWIILSIISILLYLCVFDMNAVVSYGSITTLVLYEMYFRGDCELDFPPDYTPIKTGVSTVLSSWFLFIWVCVYLAVSLIWLISSTLILTHVKRSNINVSIAVLYTWATTTLVTCCMDLGLGIIFGIDFSQYQWKAYQTSIQGNPNLVQLVAAEYSAIFMMIVALKGVVLWLINFGLMICVFIGASVARDTLNDSINHAFTFNNTHGSPIHAFEPKEETGFDNDAFVVEQRHHKSPVELNEESIKRAARISTDNLQTRLFRNIESFEQYPPAKLPQLSLQQPPHQNLNQIQSYEPTVPAPDYTPPMPRANQNGHVRNSRYQ